MRGRLSGGGIGVGRCKGCLEASGLDLDGEG